MEFIQPMLLHLNKNDVYWSPTCPVALHISLQSLYSSMKKTTVLFFVHGCISCIIKKSPWWITLICCVVSMATLLVLIFFIICNILNKNYSLKYDIQLQDETRKFKFCDSIISEVYSCIGKHTNLIWNNPLRVLLHESVYDLGQSM